MRINLIRNLLAGQNSLQINYFLLRIILILTYSNYWWPKSLCGSIISYEVHYKTRNGSTNAKGRRRLPRHRWSNITRRRTRKMKSTTTTPPTMVKKQQPRRQKQEPRAEVRRERRDNWIQLIFFNIYWRTSGKIWDFTSSSRHYGRGFRSTIEKVTIFLINYKNAKKEDVKWKKKWFSQFLDSFYTTID